MSNKLLLKDQDQNQGKLIFKQKKSGNQKLLIVKDNTMTKRKRQTMVYKTLYGKLKIEQYELQ
jgi:ribosomal protein L30E